MTNLLLNKNKVPKKENTKTTVGSENVNPDSSKPTGDQKSENPDPSKSTTDSKKNNADQSKLNKIRTTKNWFEEIFEEWKFLLVIPIGIILVLIYNNLMRLVNVPIGVKHIPDLIVTMYTIYAIYSKEVQLKSIMKIAMAGLVLIYIYATLCTLYTGKTKEIDPNLLQKGFNTAYDYCDNRNSSKERRGGDASSYNEAREYKNDFLVTENKKLIARVFPGDKFYYNSPGEITIVSEKGAEFKYAPCSPGCLVDLGRISPKGENMYLKGNGEFNIQYEIKK